MMQVQCPKCKEIFSIGYTKTANYLAGQHTNKCQVNLIPFKEVN